MRRIRISHLTRYEYALAVSLLEHRLLLRPREGHDIRIEASLLDIDPAYDIVWSRDIYGNSVASVRFRTPTALLSIASDVIVQHYEDRPLDFAVAASAVSFPFRYDPIEQVDLMPYQLSVFPQDNEVIGQWVRRVWVPGTVLNTLDLLDRLNHGVADELGYCVREEPGIQSPATTLGRKQGSCRDLATLFIEACRYCGLAARFVTGYLLSNAAVRDQGATHAWAEIYLPGAGWRGFDSTSGLPTGGDHIAVAVNRRPDAVPPVAGAYVGPSEPAPRLTVTVQVHPL
jgi:transglutaminase-like putative cysteine protease